MYFIISLNELYLELIFSPNFIHKVMIPYLKKFDKVYRIEVKYYE